ncbi:MAG: cell division protein ZapE [Gammaproteobacteria bacterium]|nr:cell division protein ZapE [Gammaproteobacteria bacterium]MBT4607101.1 cell division protein ZapE [Thiotrichales bacterium]MBT5747338.1 cell division protein ZapE [Gammaproteobacteria bacterium]
MDQYLQQVEHQEIVRDPGQLKVVEALQCALDRMNHQGWWCRLFKKRQQGVFIWGDVGVGKTWLMDQFYRAAPEKKKIRYHYHEFMEMLHGSMPDHKHRPNPLDAIANKLAGHYRLICIDEFHVTEIADAMLLYGILEGLFKRQVMLVTTSNRVPDRLYEKGFHRDLFLPAIELLKRYNMVVELESHTDYRVANSEVSRQQVVQELGQPELEAIFANLAQSEPWEQHSLQINQRTLPVIKVAEGVVWLDYQVLCSNPRATSDYIELAHIFSAVIVSNIDARAAANESYAWRFLHFVDELYDHQIQLVISAVGQLMQVYQNEALRFQFARTVSRLHEMQSAIVQQQILLQRAGGS